MTERSCIPDLIIIGSGAAGLTAATTALASDLTVTVLEAGLLVGGATALSEGMIWAPNSPAALALPDAPSVKVERDAALAYLAETSGNFFDRERAEAYLDAVNPMMALIGAYAGLTFTLNRTSQDYYPENPHARRGIRAHNPDPVDMRTMDRELFTKLRPPLGTMQLLGGMSVASSDLAFFHAAARDPRAALWVARLVARYALDRIGGWPRGTRVANGNVIVARLAHGVASSGGRIVTRSPVQALMHEGGRVCGVITEDGTLRARLGVILCSGGLNANAGGRAKLVGQPRHIALPAAETAPHLEALVAGTGAIIETGVAQPVLWAPASFVPDTVPRAGAWPHFSDRAKPGVICVGPDGRRFANEAKVYHDFVPALIDAYGRHPDGAHCWIVADHAALRRYGLGPIGPFPDRLGPYLRAGYLRRGSRPETLANEIGVDPRALIETIDRFNLSAREGKDPEFGRGLSAYDRGNGDPANRPNATLGPLERAPFYAIRIHPGDIGTFVGLRTDAAARVITKSRAPVPGFWAAGNAAAPMTGGTYAAAGLTIGAAMTFGYLAAQDAAQIAGSRPKMAE